MKAQTTLPDWSIALVKALEHIRDSTFRDAATLRMYADKALNEHRSNATELTAAGAGELGEADRMARALNRIEHWLNRYDCGIDEAQDTLDAIRAEHTTVDAAIRAGEGNDHAR